MAKKGNLQIDLSGVTVQSSRTVVPTGVYSVELVSCEPVEAKKKGNYFLKTDFKIISGEHEGVTITERYNFVNSNKDAERIGKSQLKTMLTASGFKNPDYLGDTSEALGLKLNLYLEEVDHSFTNNDGDKIDTTQNEVKSYMEFKEVSAEPVEKEAPKKKAPAKKKAEPAPQPEETEAAPSGGFPWENA